MIIYKFVYFFKSKNFENILKTFFMIRSFALNVQWKFCLQLKISINTFFLFFLTEGEIVKPLLIKSVWFVPLNARADLNVN